MDAMLGTNLATAAMARPEQSTSGKSWLNKLGLILGRSMFPFAALTIILSTVLSTAVLGPGWGPFVTLALAYFWWRVVTKIG